MRKRGRAILASTLLAGACQQSVSQAPVPVNAVASAASSLWRDPVTAERYARRVLYTWTTTAQIDELRRERQLLVREESPEHGASYYEQIVHAIGERGDAVAKLLDTVTFAKSRFAWPAPWATREGLSGESYGGELIRVTLRANAIVIALSATKGAIEARDLDGAIVPLVDVIAHPERIGAVYFDAGSYREYVLCNESMIASWSVGTRDIADELATEIGALTALANELRDRPPTREQLAGFTAAQAFEHALELSYLDELVHDLRATPKQVALEGGGDVAWPGIGVPRPPPRIVPKSRGTYGSFGRGSY